MNFGICAYFVVVKKRLKINFREYMLTLQTPAIFASFREITTNKKKNAKFLNQEYKISL